MLLISNMYPDKKHPSYGIFVKKFCEQLEQLGTEFDKTVMLKGDSKFQKVVGYLKFYLGATMKLLVSKYDIVYVHYASHSGIPVLLVNKLKRITVYTNVHGSDVAPENTKQEKLQGITRKLLKISKKVIVPSDYFKDYVAGKYGIDEKNIYIFPSAGVDKDIFHPFYKNVKDDVKKNIGINNGLMTFGMAGRISAYKGWDTFVDAVKIVLYEGHKANFIIVGEGIENHLLEKRIRKNNLENNIIRIGLMPQGELAKYFSMLDFFVFPTKREGESLGLVAIEAMACGTPVIASDFAAPKYYVKNGYNGYKFAMGNANELARIMIDILQDSAAGDLKDLSIGAQRTAAEYQADKLQEPLKSIIES